MDYMVIIAIIIIAAILLWVLFAKVLKNKTVKKNINDIDVDPFIEAVGGLANIKECLASNSKLKFILDNDDLIDLEKLKVLGASGIVQSNHKLTLIIGQASSRIADKISSQL